MSANTVIQALESLERARSSGDRAKVLRRFSSAELKAVLRLAFGEPLWTAEDGPFPEAPTRVNQRIFSDLNWYNALMDLQSRSDLAVFFPRGDKHALVGWTLGMCQPQQRKWAERILTGDLGFAMSKWDVQNVLGTL